MNIFKYMNKKYNKPGGVMKQNAEWKWKIILNKLMYLKYCVD